MLHLLHLFDHWRNGGIAVIAAAPVKGVRFSSQYYYLGLTILVVLMIVALVKAYRIWEEIHDVEEPDTPQDLLKTFEDAHAEGGLDDQELERVRQHLVDPAAGRVPASESPSPKDKALNDL